MISRPAVANLKNRAISIMSKVLRPTSATNHLANIHLINLDRSVDRMQAFKRINGHLKHYTRVSAIDGNSINWEEVVSKNLFKRECQDDFTTGAIGCALSHFHRWQYAIESGKPITIGEDDAIVHHDFEAAVPRMVSMLPPDWDIIIWGWNLDAELIFDFLRGVTPCRARFDENTMRDQWANFQETSIHPQSFRLYNSWGTVCYSVSPKGAEALIRHCIPFAAPVDISMNEHYLRLAAFVCFPPLVITLNDRAASTVLTEALVI